MSKEYAIQGRFPGPHGWEDVCVEIDATEARARLREYRDNDPCYPYRVVERETS